MDVFDWLQIISFFTILFLLVKPIGVYMARVYRGERTLLSPLLLPCENLLYRICGVNKAEEMGWLQYSIAMLLFNLSGFLVLFALLRMQHLLPLNPQHLPPFSWQLALNTAVSFTTNTNWQAYSGETAATYLTQMAGLTVQNFVSAATGMAVAVALIRGFARRTTSTIGNFWTDVGRSVLYILLPLASIAALLLVSQGVIQNLDPYKIVPLVQATNATTSQVNPDGRTPAKESINTSIILPMGPVASQEAIKELGTNGGGFFNANSTHPFENPTPLSHFLEMLLILLIPAGLTATFGVMVGNPRQGWTLLAVMLLLLLAAFGILQWVEANGIPHLARLGIEGGNMEGKEVRFGLVATSLFEVVTTATSCGAVAAMHDSLTPLGGLVPLSFRPPDLDTFYVAQGSCVTF